MSTPEGQLDVFLSYPRKDGVYAERLFLALSKRLRVWFDRSELKDFADITRGITSGLIRAKCIVCYYSKTYNERRACQWELMTAYSLWDNGQSGGNRVLVINPEGDHTHIPEFIRSCVFCSVDPLGSADAWDQVAGKVLEHVACLTGSLGDFGIMQVPEWYPRATTPWPRFKNRLLELWAIHGCLRRPRSRAIHGQEAPATAVTLAGMAGIGKSLLAEEYAIRFGYSYGAGVYWLRGPETAQRNRETLLVQLEAIVNSLGGSANGMSVGEMRARIAAHIESRGSAALWVVDSLPLGLSRNEVMEWLGPHSEARSLLTTRGTYYEVGPQVVVHEFGEDAALALVGDHVILEADSEKAITRITASIGYHPLACEVLGAWIRVGGHAQVEKALASEDQDAFERGKEFVNELPHDQEKSATRLIAASMRDLPREALLCLGLASCIGTAVIRGEVFEHTFAEMQEEADRWALGLRALEKRSLIRQVLQRYWIVHPMVTKAAKLLWKNAGTWAGIGEAGAQALRKLLTPFAGSGHSPTWLTDVAHAEELFWSGEQELVLILGRVLVIHEQARGQWQNGLEIAREFRRHVASRLGDEHWMVFGATVSEIGCLIELGHVAEARRVLGAVGAKAIQVLGSEHELVTELIMMEAYALRLTGDFPNSLKLHVDAANRVIKQHGEDSPEYARALNNLAVILSASGKYEQAAGIHEDLLKYCVKTWGDNHPNTCNAKMNLADVLSTLGRKERSLELLEDCLRVRRSVLGDSHPLIAHTMSALGHILLLCGKVDEGVKMCRDAVVLSTRVLGEKHPMTALFGSALYGYLVKAGRGEEAAEYSHHQSAVPDGLQMSMALSNMIRDMQGRGMG